MKKLVSLIVFCALAASMHAQLTDDIIAKRERHKNLVVTEWNQDAKGKNGWKDHVTTYDEQGRKVEEIELATYGQVQRVRYYYEDNAVGKVTKEEVFDARNKLVRVRMYTYNADGTKNYQYNYLPSGKLYSTKHFEYQFVNTK